MPRAQLKQLKEKLFKLKREILSSEPASILVGADILSGLTNATINTIVKNCTSIMTIEDIQTLGVTSFHFAAEVYEIVSEFKTVTQ